MAEISLIAVAAVATTAGTTTALVATTVATIVGAAIDALFIFPALFGGKGAAQGPKFNGLGVQTAGEGDPMKYALGGQNRVAGTLIWTSGVKQSSKKVGGNKHSSGTRVYTYTVDVAVAVCEGPIAGIGKIWASSKVIYDASTGFYDKRVCKGIGIYTGTSSQAVDPTIYANQGANTPAYRGTAYVVFKSVNLSWSGNIIPQFQFQVAAQTFQSVPGAISSLLLRAGLVSNQYDTTLCSGFLRGFILSGPQSAITGIEPLLAAFGIYTQESNGVLKFIQRGLETSITVDSNDLSSREHVAADSPMLPTRPLLMADQPDILIPSVVHLGYIDYGNDYQQASVTEKMRNAPYTGVNQISFPMTLSAGEARSIAARRLIQSYSERIQVKFDLPPSYFGLQENDIAVITYNGENYSVRCEQIDRGNNYLINVTGTLVRTSTFTPHTRNELCSTYANKTPYVPSSVVTYPFLLDVPALNPGDLATGGIYFTFSMENTAAWSDGDLFSSGDDITWTQRIQASPSGCIGFTTSALGTGPVGIWDIVNALNIVVISGTLNSATDLEVYNGANRIYIGGELIAFGTATLTGVNQYTIKRLLRGLNCTDNKVGTHAIGEDTILFQSDNVDFLTLSVGDIGITKDYEIVPEGGVAGTFPNFSNTYVGNIYRQFSPINIVGSRDGSNNLTISWMRRTRYPNFPIITSAGTPPILAAAETYLVVIYNTSFTAIRRTATVTGPSYVYLAADQTADGYTLGNPVYLVVYQMGDQGVTGYPSIQSQV